MKLMTELVLMKITLVTCEDAAATERIIVKGDLKETKDYSQTSDEILTASINHINNFISSKRISED